MILYKLRLLLTKRFYIVGIQENLTISNKDVKWLKFPGYKKNWLADPFVLKDTDTSIVLFAEQMVASKNKGKIVRVIVDKTNYKITSIVDLLELDTHLSFPIIYRENGKVYVYPENYESGSLKIYEYNEVTSKLDNPRTIIDEPLLDTQIVKISGVYYAFGVKHSSGKLDDTKVLYIYKSDNLFGPYFQVQVIENNLCEERGAGEIFIHGSMLLRPAQCCESDYGKCVILYDLVKEDNNFREIEIQRILPCSLYPEGLHTYSKYNTISVIDSNAYVYGNLISFMKRILKKTSVKMQFQKSL